MKSEYVISAFRNFIKGNREEAVRIVRMIEACERSNGNATVAAKIKRVLDGIGQTLLQLPNAPKEMAFTVPTRTLDSIIISDVARGLVDGILREWTHREALAQHDLPPRNILLICGPSGNGKTSLAQAISTALGLPFGMVAYNEVIDSHMGDTAKSVSMVLDFAVHTPCIVMFDEADAIVTERRHGEGSSASRECNLTVNQLLIKLDNLGTRSMAVFATNRDDVLDAAMKRRVHQKIELCAPGEDETRRMVELCKRRWPILGDWQPDSRSSFAAIEASAMTAARQRVLASLIEV